MSVDRTIHSNQIKCVAHDWFVWSTIIQASLMICFNLFPSNRAPSSVIRHMGWRILSMDGFHPLGLVYVSSVILLVWTGLPACIQSVDVSKKHHINFFFFWANKRRRHLITVYVSDSRAWDMRPLEFSDLKWTAPAGRVIIVLFALILVPYRANICSPLASGADSRTLMETVGSLTPLLKWWLDQNGNILL